MGTVEDYLVLHGRLLKKEIPLWAEFSIIPRNSFLVDRHVSSEALTLQDWGCVGHAQLDRGVILKRCVVWDDAQIKEGTELSDTLVV